jgi:lipopolysaccharide transport system ATP-binding protein
MPLAFPGFDLTAPDGCVIGIIGEDGAGKSRLLRSAQGARYLGPGDPLDLSPAPAILMEHTFARHDALARDRAALALESLRRAGTTLVIISHEEDLLRRLADEVWWIDGGKLAGRGDPGEVLAAYHRHIAEKFRASAEGRTAPSAPRMRRGDGRAEVASIETIGENGCPTMVWQSGELAAVRVRVRFAAAVQDPVVGIMIRTRIGLNVYGTNTELENVKLGPRAAGDTIEVTFAFRCELCPEEYTLTVASHDPHGVWHDWLEDAVAFAVTDARYTAGVANLRARVTFTSDPG